MIYTALGASRLFIYCRSSGVTFGFREAVVKDAVTTNQMTPEKIDESTVQSECEDEDDSVTMETNGHVYTDSEYPFII